MSGIQPSLPNFRAEIARYKISRADICAHIDIHPNQLSNLLGGKRPISFAAAHNLGYAINKATGLQIFNVDMSAGEKPYKREAHKYIPDPDTSIRLPTPPKGPRKRYPPRTKLTGSPRQIGARGNNQKYVVAKV